MFDETIRVGTAAEGATIKEGSYLVVKDRLAQIIDGMAVAVPIRNGKGSDGIPARHARIIRGLVQIRDAVRDVLRAQEADLPMGRRAGPAARGLTPISSGSSARST